MKRLLLIGAMALLFVLGLLAGAVLTPAARADGPALPQPPLFPPAAQAYRWYPQDNLLYSTEVMDIIRLPDPLDEKKAVTMMIDKKTGNTYALNRNGDRYFWTSIVRQ
jgi:hypothetical protein